MRKYILFLFASFFIYFNSLAQSFKTYKATYEFHATFSEEANYDTYLYFNDNFSQYIDYREQERYELGKGMFVTAVYKNIINNFYFKTKEVKENRYLRNNKFKYATWKNDLEWTITDETKQIGAYTARKAITQSFENPDDSWGDAIVWFTTDIPVPSGPARYYGLPGLILEIEFEYYRGKYTFKGVEEVENYEYKGILETNLVDKVEIVRP